MHDETCGGLKPEFIDGVRDFIEQTMTLDIFKNNGLVRYFVWIDHGERDGLNGMFYNSMHVDEYNMLAPHGQIRVLHDMVEHDRVHEIINDAFRVQGGMEPEQFFDEAPNEEARRFYDQLEESSRPLREGSPHSALSHSTQLVRITDTLGDSPFGLLHRLSALAFSIFASWIIGGHSTTSRNCSTTHQLLLFTADLILSFRAQHIGTKGEDKTFW
ncbi:hypothetical protein H5410_036343 [Solanum commersonii]|uniref:Uncharacterized protein n=1 Tax=Solanum commersonii TaxID=4109 RepID=A0A9J5Y5C7_SOLCO|nr:hypothetical protein H5410_036343 [Solanum commersonii]